MILADGTDTDRVMIRSTLKSTSKFYNTGKPICAVGPLTRFCHGYVPVSLAQAKELLNAPDDAYPRLGNSSYVHEIVVSEETTQNSLFDEVVV